MGQKRTNAVLGLITALKQCGKRGDLEAGKDLHLQTFEGGSYTNKYVCNALITMYGKCRNMLHARAVFDNMIYWDVVSWNSLLLGYVENGESLLAFDLFTSMDCKQDAITYVAALKACAGLGCLVDVHKQARELGFDTDIFVATTLVDMYRKCGSMLDARAVFDTMLDWNVVSWNSLILGYIENGESVLAMDLFASMDFKPDSYTFVAAIKACGGSCLGKGRAIHKQVNECGLLEAVFVATALIDMYRNLGCMQSARRVFDSMVSRNVVSWNSLLNGYVENGETLVAMELFSSMDCEPNTVTYVAALKACACSVTSVGVQACLEKGKAIHTQIKEHRLHEDILVGNALVFMYIKCRSMLSACAVFDNMNTRDVISWNSLLSGCVENDESMKALDLLTRMDVKPDCITYVTALKACGNLGEVSSGERIHSEICKLGYERRQAVATCLVDFYGKCMNMVSAEHVFNSMCSEDINTVAWNALLAGYSSVGKTSRVFSIMKRMHEDGVEMDSVTLLLILTCCSHAGMVDEGRKCFEWMCRDVMSLPSMVHYACVVDMLGRVHRLEEALDVIKSMPYEADGVVWRTLLAACRKWNNLEIGKVAFDALRTCKDNNGAGYVLMSNIYKNSSI